MKKILIGILVLTSLSTYAKGLICTANITIAPQSPTDKAITKKVWLMPTTPDEKEYTAELLDLNAFVKASVRNETDVVLSASELDGNLSVSNVGSVKDDGVVSLIITSNVGIAGVSCRK